MSDISFEIGLPLLLVLFLGLPHGAADAAVAKRTAPRVQAWLFAATYIGLAVCFGGLWLVLPSLCLLTFMLMSMFHFGQGDANAYTDHPHLSATLAHGGGVVFAIINFHPQTVGYIFVLLGSQEEVVNWLRGLSVMWLAMLVFAFGKGSISGRAMLEIGALWCLCALLPPLWGFAIYFCFIHGVRHMRRLRGTGIVQSRRDWLTVGVFSGLAIAVAGLGMRVQPELIFDDALTRTVFILLAALTVPHMLLIDYMMGRKNAVA